ncbi:MAG: Clp1/GlmU family protein [Candidatus Nezhaarchaeales archaeon]
MNRLHLPKNTYYEVKGPVSIKLVEGLLSVLNKPVRPRDVLTIPRSKTLPVEVIEDSLIEAKLGVEAGIRELPSSPIPREWNSAAEKVVRSSGWKRIVVLGDTGSGKTHFCTFLANKFVEGSFRVGILDCDLDQAEIFIPTTIALGLIENFVTGIDRATLVSSFFVGSISPVGLEGRVVAGVRALLEEAARLKVDALIVNTDGWSLGRAARLLKQGLLASIMPSHLILIQRETEMEHIARPYEMAHGAEVLRLPVPPFARLRSKEDEKIERELAFKAYFSKARARKFSLNNVGLMYTLFTTGFELTKERLKEVEEVVGQQVAYGEEGADSIFIVLKKTPSAQIDELAAQLRERLKKKEVLIMYPGAERGIIVGLLDRSQRMLGLGLIEEIDYEGRVINIITPVEGEVGFIQVGQLRLDSEYRGVAEVNGWPL